MYGDIETCLTSSEPFIAILHACRRVCIAINGQGEAINFVFKRHSYIVSHIVFVNSIVQVPYHIVGQLYHYHSYPPYLSRFNYKNVYLRLLPDVRNRDISEVNADMKSYIPLETAAIFFLANLFLKQGILAYVMVDFICTGKVL